ncbi:hypothetical protein NPIL_115041 [Nephila pilipes]|uniref:Uncharacterized protein n=1 Tax=Nephila pilipes TaxID=299642 RepID=A0A8X6QEP2_NEPPI|nr:hypothetical protein NPIL_115041 [Nephila pilipes]
MSSTPEPTNPGECLSLFLGSYSVDTIRSNSDNCKTSSDCLNLNLFIEDKLNKIPILTFPNEKFKIEIGNNLKILIEEARFKYSTLKQEEIKNGHAQFNNLCTAWGIANPHVLPNPSPAKQRGNFSPSENPKKQKIDENPFYNIFSPLPIDEPSTQIEIDEEDITDPVTTSNHFNYHKK